MQTDRENPEQQDSGEQAAPATLAEGPATTTVSIPATRTQASSEKQAAQEPLYDPDADQTFNFNFQGRGKNRGRTYPVKITFGPLKDAHYIAYDKQRDVRMAGVADGIDTSNESHGASLYLGKLLLKRVEGWGPEDGSELSDERLADAVQAGLLACDIMPGPEPIEGDAAADAPWETDDLDEEPIRLRCIAEGRLIVTEHTPGDVPDEVVERLRKRMIKLRQRGKLVDSGSAVGRRETKVPSRAEEKGAIYDELRFTATRYRGRVPLHHKEKIVDEFFDVQQELVEGK